MTDLAAKPLKILVVMDTIGVGGGAEQLMLTLLPALNARGHKAEILALGDWTPDLGPDFAARGVQTHFLHARGRFAFLHSIVGLRRLIAVGAVDVVWSHSRQSSMAATIALCGSSLPHVALLHSEGHALMGPLPMRARVTTALEKFLLSRPTKIAVSRAVAQDYQTFFGWPPIEVISNCFDPSDLPQPLDDAGKAEARAQFGVAPKDFLLITPARFVAKKGYPVLIEALRILRDTRGWSPVVHAFGHGPLKDEITKSAARTGVQLTVHESVRQNDLFRLIRAADGVVLPSLREPFGIAALEAMALGAPLVLSNVDGLKEITEGRGCALAVAPKDPAALANAMWDLYHDKVAAAGRVARGFSVARAYEPRKIADEWSALFMRCVADLAQAQRRV